jgi:hypothetical protein
MKQSRRRNPINQRGYTLVSLISDDLGFLSLMQKQGRFDGTHFRTDLLIIASQVPVTNIKK